MLQLCFNFGLFRSDSSCTKQITTMNNDVIENVFNSTISFKSLKCHLLLHPGHTANIRRKSLLPKSPLCVTNLVKLLDCSLNSNETHFCVSGFYCRYYDVHVYLPSWPVDCRHKVFYPNNLLRLHQLKLPMKVFLLSLI